MNKIQPITSTAKREDTRSASREEVAKRWHDHAKQQGSDVSFEKVQRHVNERAEIIDKKRDWK